MRVSMRLFAMSKEFPKEEMYSLTDQIRRSSRAVCANLAESWRKRRYPAAFVSKLCDAEAEAAETQVWIEYAVRCGYLQQETGKELYEEYNSLLNALVGMILHQQEWTHNISEEQEVYTISNLEDPV
jgi:four helix bundle protein